MTSAVHFSSSLAAATGLLQLQLIIHVTVGLRQLASDNVVAVCGLSLSVNWEEARELCGDLYDSDLATLDTRELYREAKEVMKNVGNCTHDAWIGYVNPSIFDNESDWHWLAYYNDNDDNNETAEAGSLDRWAANEPMLVIPFDYNETADGPLVNCAAMQRPFDYQWYAEDCEEAKRQVLCAAAPTVSPTPSPSRSPSVPPTLYPTAPPTVFDYHTVSAYHVIVSLDAETPHNWSYAQNDCRTIFNTNLASFQREAEYRDWAADYMELAYQRYKYSRPRCFIGMGGGNYSQLKYFDLTSTEIMPIDVWRRNTFASGEYDGFCGRVGRFTSNQYVWPWYWSECYKDYYAHFACNRYVCTVCSLFN